MPDNELSEDMKKQVDAAMSGSKDTLNSPAEGTISQPVPDAPADMSNVPDAYDVKGQEAFRAGKREQAVEARDAAPETSQTAEPAGNTPEADEDAILKAGAKLKSAGVKQEVEKNITDAAPADAAPAPDASLEPAPAPKAPDIDRE